jgi:hypothetical protein
MNGPWIETPWIANAVVIGALLIAALTALGFIGFCICIGITAGRFARAWIDWIVNPPKRP